MSVPELLASPIENFDGLVLTPHDDGYDEARSIWNGMIDRRPALILQPRSTAAVSAAVRYAVSRNLPVAIKGGGHSAPGYSMCDDGIVIDLHLMDAVSVDPVTKRATGQGGALLGSLDAATAEHGLVVPAGAISHTGMGGLVLGGGFGHIMRKFGLSIDSLIGAEVVLADGSVVNADADHNPELFWALRGGSGNFGIVTEFRFQCHDFVPLVYVHVNIIELQHAKPVLETWRAEMKDAPDELAWIAFFRGAPDLPGFEFIPLELRNKPILLMPMLWAGDPSEGQAYIDGLLTKLDHLAVSVGSALPYPAIQSQWDDVFAHGRRHYAKAGFLDDVPDELIDSLIAAAEVMPNPLCQIEVLRLGGAVARVDQNATAFSHRDAEWPINVIGLWEDPADDEAGTEWVRSVYAAAEPFMSGGAYVNYAGGEETGGTESSYGQTWARLVELKEKYDPENVFRFNANLQRTKAQA